MEIIQVLYRIYKNYENKINLEIRPSQINHLFNVTNPPQICHFFKNKQTGHVITDWQHLIGQKNFILNSDFVDRHINYILYQLIDLQSLF